jgi:Cd2+/Zn2+-exporting ATPase
MAHQTIDLAAEVPAEAEKRLCCADCIRQRLMGRQGVRGVKVKLTDRHALIELDYDPSIVTLAQLERDVKHAGMCLADDLVHMVVPVEGMYTAAAEQLLEAALNRMPHLVAQASYPAGAVRLEFDKRHCPLVQIMQRMQELGFRPRFDLARKTATEQEAARRMAGAAGRQAPPAAARDSRLVRAMRWLAERPQPALTLLGGLLLAMGWSVGLMRGPQELRIALLAGAYLAAGWHTGIDTLRVLRAARFDIDVLMFAAAFGAAALGHYEEGALLLFLFGLGTAGENLAMDRARHAIEALTKLAPQTATLREPDGSTRHVPVDQLRVGDIVVVQPFDRVPADGKVAAGASAVDQSPLTGESTPVEKVVGAEVMAGTINGEGQLQVRVAKLAGDTTLAKIVRLVAEAQTTRSPTQTFTDRVERWYVPLVLAGTAGVMVVPPLLGWSPSRAGGIWAGWFYQAMAFLTAASPCALAIGTPAAVLCGIARAARIGVLIKGGVHLENLGRVKAMAFDKTGTLTQGRPVVTDVAVFAGDLDDARVLALAASVEQAAAGHPLAAAIVAEAHSRGLELREPTDIEFMPGRGVRGRVGRHAVAVGRLSMSDELPEPVSRRSEQLQRQGRTVAMVMIDGRPAGLIALADQMRPNVAAALNRLREIGVERCMMLTGDHVQAAQAVAAQAGTDEFHADLMPEDKVKLLARLKDRYGRVAMVGDGVNDAPALAAASVGIAMGGAGTDVALETADVVLMSDDLARLPSAVELSRFSRRIVIQNLVIALGVIAVLAPSAALGWTPLGIAVMFHEGSTVLVVLNSLRLLGHRFQ